MYFLYPLFLWLLIVPLFFLFYTFKVRKRGFEKHFSQEMLKKLTLHSSMLSSRIKQYLFLLALALFIVALARPVQPRENTQTSLSKTSVIIAVDASKSMHQTDIYPSRYQLALQKLKDFVAEAKGFNLGILFYAQDAYMLYPLSQDTTALHTLVKDINITQKFAPNTNLFSALEAASSLLKETKNRHLLLLSDGGEDVTRDKELVYLKQQHITLSTLAISKKPNPSMRKLCEQTGGVYQAFSWSKEDIKTLMHAMTLKPKEKQNYLYDVPHFQEYYPYPLGLGIVLLLLLFFPLQKKAPLFQMVLLLVVAPFGSSLHAGILDFWHIHKAEQYTADRNYSQAAKEYQHIAPTSQSYYNTATALYKAKAYIEAVSYYKKALRKKDKHFNAKVFYNIATAYVRKHKLDLAKKYYQKSLALYPLKEAKENLSLVKQQLKVERKNLHKAYQKLQFKPIAKQNSFAKQNVFNSYAVKLHKLLPSQEEQWFAKILKQHAPSYLQKIPTTKRSQDANKTW